MKHQVRASTFSIVKAILTILYLSLFSLSTLSFGVNFQPYVVSIVISNAIIILANSDDWARVLPLSTYALCAVLFYLDNILVSYAIIETGDHLALVRNT